MEKIQIEINNHRKVFSVRELFTQKFNNLKLEFYAKPNTEYGPHSDKIVRNSGFTIGDCRTSNHNGVLTILPGMTVQELKDYLNGTFGLRVEVYKLADSSWQIIDSGSDSLEELNQSNEIS